MGYADVYEGWRADPEGFWMEAAGAIDWERAPSRAMQGLPEAPAWFADGRVNGCWNAVDRHVEAGYGERVAVIHDSPVTGDVTRLTYAELQGATERLAGALARRGVGAGDRVVIYMPMVPEAVVAMLACARIGAIHSVVFGGFAARELAVRIDDCRPKAVLAASCGVEPTHLVRYGPLLDAALAQARHAPELVVMLQREAARAEIGEDWHAFQEGAEPADCVAVPGEHPAYILYTSGTTGSPRAWCGRPPGTSWRSPGRCPTSTA